MRKPYMSRSRCIASIFILTKSATNGLVVPERHQMLPRIGVVPTSTGNQRTMIGCSISVTRYSAVTSTLHALPTCAAEQVVPLVLKSGAIGLGSQMLLTKVLGRSGGKNSKRIAPYTAHTVVAMALMLLASTFGIVGWLCDKPALPYDRLVSPSSSARWLAAVISGMFLFWDIPTSLYVQRLRKWDVITHHIAMAVVALVGATCLPMAYLFFYFGISELSSIPLLVYDQASFLFEERKRDNNKMSTVASIRDASQLCAAFSFTVVRAIWFTKVTLCNFIPDICTVLQGSTSRLPSSAVTALQFGGVMSIAFTCLQLFWFSKMLRVMLGDSQDS